MTEEEKISKEEQKREETAPKVTLGLELSDVDAYHVNDGVTDESFDAGRAADDAKHAAAEKRKAGAAGRIGFFILGMLFCAGIMLLCTQVLGLGHFVTDRTYKYYTELDGAYGKYYEIMKMIGDDPIAKSEPESIGDEELKSIVAGTGDPYAEYYTAEEYEDFQKRYLGDYVGIGIGVVQEDDNIVIKAVFEDTPAADADIKEGDVIVKVDGRKPADVDDAVSMISGEPGTEVTLTLKRGDGEFDLSLKRQKIETDSVGYSPLADHPKVGYIQIASFIKDTDSDFKNAVKELKSEGCEKFIIDLRDNGGGLTDSSINIADYLLPACRIMSENTKNGNETVYNSKESSADLDMAILVNENTASASEILTAALQDNNAGKVIGTVTFGKGVTQNVHKFKDGSAVKITVTEYFRPNGKKVNGVGITPDIEAEGEEALDAALRELGE